MNLIPVAEEPLSVPLLFDLLAERRPEQSISHKRMPTYAEHCAFVASKPYAAWYLIESGGHYVGSVYLTRAREVGIFIFKAHQGSGHAVEALRELLRLHPGPALANVAPGNEPSHRLFASLGGRVIQHTYEFSIAST